MNKPRIYTSYYANIGKFDPEKFIRIQISRACPVEGSIDYKWTEVMPSWDLLNKYKANAIDNNEYIAEYKAQLDAIGDKLQSIINALSNTPDKTVVLFCYESPEKFCHRHILADWYNKRVKDTIITEYENL